MNQYGLKLEENPKDHNEIIIDTIYTDYDKRFAINFVKLKYSNFDGTANFPMLSLILTVNNEETHIQRYNMAIYQWKEMLGEIEKIEKTYKEGFYCHHGLGDPLKEFEEGDIEDFSYFVPRTPTIWFLLGNHKKRSGVFHYFVWKPDLIESIKQRMKPEQIKTS